MTIINDAINKLKKLQHELIKKNQDSTHVDEEIRKQNQIILENEEKNMANKTEGKKTKAKTEEKTVGRKMKEGGLSEQLLEVLSKNKGKEMRPCEIAEKLGIDSKKASDYLWVMAKRGQIQRGNKTYYV